MIAHQLGDAAWSSKWTLCLSWLIDNLLLDCKIKHKKENFLEQVKEHLQNNPLALVSALVLASIQPPIQ